MFKTLETEEALMTLMDIFKAKIASEEDPMPNLTVEKQHAKVGEGKGG